MQMILSVQSGLQFVIAQIEIVGEKTGEESACGCNHENSSNFEANICSQSVVCSNIPVNTASVNTKRRTLSFKHVATRARLVRHNLRI